MLGIILAFSAFFRLYRLNQLLGFWYDQGRDALVIWDLLHYHKFFLIGPVTGIDGVFLGPFYYYLLALLYWLGRGSPVFAAAGLVWLTVGAVFLIYFLARKIYNGKVGLLAAFLYGFSSTLVVFSRWLSNPEPLPFFTLLVLLCLYFWMEKRQDWFLVPAAFILGLCLQLEAASAVFFLPAAVIFLFWQRRIVRRPVILLLALLAFSITLLPQMIFNWRHDGILFAAFKKFLVTDRSFRFSFVQTLKDRCLIYYDAFAGKFFAGHKFFKMMVLALFSAGLWFSRQKVLNQGGKLLAIWLLTPLVCFLFYHGNHGYVWDYYFTGYIPAFVILFSAGVFYLMKKWRFLGLFLAIFLLFFVFLNLRELRNYYAAGMGISLRAQLKAIDWIYTDAGSEEFNVDVYVPPQIYFAYSYLFHWYGARRYGREPATVPVKNLYTLAEPDGEHPQFLTQWLARQDRIGKIVKNYSWGDITVQKRERQIYE